jgi:exopolyphosphatase/guanosine-5'-triphosphate,3'-diphosphate pyrophosphatase
MGKKRSPSARESEMRRGAFRDERERRAGQQIRGPAGPVYAAVDLGTNNCRMLAARPNGDGLRVVDSFSRIVRLGQGVWLNGRLDDEAIERTLAALRICAVKIRRLGVRRCRNVATEACRRAINTPAFLERVEADTGLVFESISPEEEARLTVAGCLPLLDAGMANVLMFDIGGGSTEIIWLDPSGGAMPRILGTLSTPVGVMTVAETYGTDVLSSPDATELTARIDEELANFDRLHGISREVAGGSVQMLGTSGTVTTLGGIHLGLTRYDRSKVDGIDVPFSAIDNLVQRLSALSVPERADIPCIGWPRADLMVAGCTLLGIICRRWPVGQLRVADRGLREGVLLELMAADGIGPAPSPFPATDSQAAVPL